jgi:hypothetical protein
MPPSTKIEFPIDICPLCGSELEIEGYAGIPRGYTAKCKIPYKLCDGDDPIFHYEVHGQYKPIESSIMQRVYNNKYYVFSRFDEQKSWIYKILPYFGNIAVIPIIKADHPDKLETRINNLLLFL